MIAQQNPCDLRFDQKAVDQALEPSAFVTHIDVVVTWMVALAAVSSLALVFWQI